MTSPPLLELLIPNFGLAFLLRAPAHLVQFGSLPFGAKYRDGDHLHLRPCGAGRILVHILDTWTSNWLVSIPPINQ